MRPLGKTQQEVLDTLKQNGSWFSGGAGCGWYWGSHSETIRVLDSLVKRGLVVISPEKGRKVYRPVEEEAKS